MHLIVFVGSAPAAGVSAALAGGESAVTSDGGSVYLSAAGGGPRELSLSVPRVLLPNASGEGALAVGLGPVDVVTGQTVAVIATLAPDGSVESIDIEGRPARRPSSSQPRTFEARPKGMISVFVRAAEGQQPIAGAQVYVRGAPVEATTDAAGRFTLELPEGAWDLSIIHAKFASGAPTSVKVTAAETEELAFYLLPTAVTLDDFVVRAPHIQGSIASVINERRESAAFKDAISAEDISKTPAGDAAGAAQRVVGVSIVDGRFVYVRGLGERYTNSLLNGLPLPSPEPDKATVPLDLFPTQTIQSIDISKTFTPDVPGDFAGGSVRIETVTVPEKLLLSASLSGGYNTQLDLPRAARLPRLFGRIGSVTTAEPARARSAGAAGLPVDRGRAKTRWHPGNAGGDQPPGGHPQHADGDHGVHQPPERRPQADGRQRLGSGR